MSYKDIFVMHKKGVYKSRKNWDDVKLRIQRNKMSKDKYEIQSTITKFYLKVFCHSNHMTHSYLPFIK